MELQRNTYKMTSILSKSTSIFSNNPDIIPWKDLKVIGFCSHKPDLYPSDRQWMSCFSQWFPAQMVIIVNEIEHKFTTCEQWMMWNKACLFKAENTAQKILATDDPKKIKSLGRTEIPEYNDDEWKKVRYEVVVKGNMAKFTQNKELRENLLQTGNRILAEAAHYDKIWGIGLKQTDPATQDQTKWKGENLLGKALMEVRQKLNE